MGNCVAKNSRLEESAFFKGTTTRGSTQKSAAVVKQTTADHVNTVPAAAPAAVAANGRPAVAASTINSMDVHAMSDRLQKLRSYNKGSAPVASPKPALSPANSMDDTTLTVLAPIMNFQRAIASPAHTESKTLSRAATLSRTNSRFARTESRLHSVPPPADEDVAQAVVQIKDRERFVQLAHNIFCSQSFEQLLARANGDVMLVRQIHFNATVSEKEHPTITLFTRMPLRLEGKEARAALLWLIQKSYDASTQSFDAVQAKAAMREVSHIAAAC